MVRKRKKATVSTSGICLTIPFDQLTMSAVEREVKADGFEEIGFRPAAGVRAFHSLFVCHSVEIEGRREREEEDEDIFFSRRRGPTETSN